MRKTVLLIAVVLTCLIPFLLGRDGPDAERARERIAPPGSEDDAASGGAARFRSANWSRERPAPQIAANRESDSLLDEYARKEEAERAAALDRKRRATARRLDGVEIAFTAPPKQGSKGQKERNR